MELARDYRPIRSRYRLPKSVYNQALWKIRDYYRWKERCEEIDHNKKLDLNSDIKSNYFTDIIENKYIQKEDYLANIRKVDDALHTIPSEYRKGVWNSIVRYDSYPLDAHRTTYSRYKSQFVYEVAERFGLI